MARAVAIRGLSPSTCDRWSHWGACAQAGRRLGQLERRSQGWDEYYARRHGSQVGTQAKRHFSLPQCWGKRSENNRSGSVWKLRPCLLALGASAGVTKASLPPACHVLLHCTGPAGEYRDNHLRGVGGSVWLYGDIGVTAGQSMSKTRSDGQNLFIE